MQKVYTININYGGDFIVSGGLFGFGIVESMLGAAVCTIIFTIGEVLMFSMTDVFIDDIAVAHLKGTYFGAMGFSGIGAVIGPWFGGVLLDYYGYQNGFVVFSALAIFSTVAFPVLLVTKSLLKKDMMRILIWKYMRNKISPSRRLELILYLF